MKHSLIKLLFVVLLPAGVCHAQKSARHQNLLPQGRWVNVQDTLYEITVRKNKIISFYKGVPDDTGEYFFSYKPCNSSYKTPVHNARFLNWGIMCFEVDGITDEYIELIYSGNGKTVTFLRKGVHI